MKTVVIILGVLVLVAGGFFLLKPSREPVPQEPAADETMDTLGKDGLTNEEDVTPGVSIEDLVKASENTLVTELVDVSGGSSNGTGYILRKDGMLYHFVEAALSTPAGNNVYEGWLVKQEPELLFFSTGVMESDGNVYTLFYSSDELNKSYNFVVITEETVVDATPETHILEGTAR